MGTGFPKRMKKNFFKGKRKKNHAWVPILLDDRLRLLFQYNNDKKYKPSEILMQPLFQRIMKKNFFFFVEEVFIKLKFIRSEKLIPARFQSTKHKKNVNNFYIKFF